LKVPQENILKSNQELHEHLNRFGTRIRLYDGWLLVQNMLPFALLAAALVLTAGRIWPLENPVLWAGLPIAAGLLGAVGYSLLRPLPAMAAARRVDIEADLKERLSSSLFFQSHQTRPDDRSDPYRPALTASLHADALETARGLDIRQAFPFEFQRMPLYTAAALVLVCVLLVSLPNPMTQVIADRRAVAEEARRQAEEIEKLKEEVEENQELSEKEKEDLRKQLEELAAQLRSNPGDLQEALADLSRVEEALKPRLDPNSLGDQVAMQALAQRLQELAGKKPSETESRDLSAAAEALSELAEAANLGSQSQRETMADNLAGLSGRASQSGQSELAQALAAMAEAVRKGNAEGAKQAAANAQQAMAKAQSSQSRQAMLNKALAKLQNSRQAMAGACKNPGAGNQPGTGAGQGQGQGQNPGSGGGSQANVLPPNTGGAMNLHGPSGGKQVNPADLLGQNIYAPRTLGGTNGEQLEITGQDSGQGQETVTESQNPLPGTNNPALVPYQEVYRQYLDAANQAMDQSYIPAYLEDYVKSYFSQLEP
jgi:hypothetical protein